MTWTCAGSSGGANASCSADLATCKPGGHAYPPLGSCPACFDSCVVSMSGIVPSGMICTTFYDTAGCPECAGCLWQSQ
jgi:hypothetical protein